VSMTIVGGAAFLSCQAYEWWHLIHEGARLTGPIAGSELIEKGVNSQFTQAFFLLTGFHGSHVLSGLVILIITAIRTSMGKTPSQGVEMAGLYWDFGDLVWGFIFTLFYLLGGRDERARAGREPLPDLLGHLGDPPRHHRGHAGRGDVPFPPPVPRPVPARLHDGEGGHDRRELHAPSLRVVYTLLGG